MRMQTKFLEFCAVFFMAAGLTQAQTIASTTNLLKGDGSGNAVDSSVSPSSIGILSATQTWTGINNFNGISAFANPLYYVATGTATASTNYNSNQPNWVASYWTTLSTAASDFWTATDVM